MQPEDLKSLKHKLPLKDYVSVLTQASMNSSGYMREVALKELGSIPTPEAVPFILRRLGDWVWIVRETAEQSIRHLLKQDSFEAFLQHLPLVHALLDKRRADLTGIHKEIVQHITRTELTELVYARIKKLPDKNRVIYVQYYLKAGKLTYQTAQLLLSDKSPLVRSQLLRKTASLDDKREQLDLLKAFLQDESAEIRSKAVTLAADFRLALKPYIWNLVADESAMVRMFARYELREECKSFAAY